MGKKFKSYRVMNLFITLVILGSCDSEKILYQVTPSKVKIVEASFKKDSLFLKWDVKKIKEEPIAAYGISYGMVNGNTIKERMIVSKYMQENGYTIRKLEEGTRYWLKIQAIYDEFSGPWSEKIEGITGHPQPPVNFTITKNTQEMQWYLELEWVENPLNKDLTIKEYTLRCWDTEDIKKHYEVSGKHYKVSTKGKLETNSRAEYICSIITKTNKDIESKAVQKRIIFDDIEKPALSSTSVAWGTKITFPKSIYHSYELKDNKGGVVSLDTSSDPATISATKPVTGIVVIAERNEYTGNIESAPITFTKKTDETFRFSSTSHNQEFNTNENKFQQTPTGVDNRDIEYYINGGSGTTIDARTGEVNISIEAIGTTFRITAKKKANEDYQEQSTTYKLLVTENTSTNAITNPQFSSTSVPWGTSITFPKIADHTYVLKETYNGIVTLDTSGDLAEITAIESIDKVILITTREGYAKEVNSDAIEFTRQEGNALYFQQKNYTQKFETNGNKFQQIPIVTNDDAEDTRKFEYSISEARGATIDVNTGEVSADNWEAIGKTFKITASKKANRKYKAQSASYHLTISVNTDFFMNPVGKF